MIYAPMTNEQAEAAWFAAYTAYFDAQADAAVNALYARMQALKAAYPAILPYRAAVWATYVPMWERA